MKKELFDEFYLKLQCQYDYVKHLEDNENIKLIVTKEALRLIKVAIHVYDKITETIVEEIARN